MFSFITLYITCEYVVFNFFLELYLIMRLRGPEEMGSEVDFIVFFYNRGKCPLPETPFEMSSGVPSQSNRILKSKIYIIHLNQLHLFIQF